MTTHNLIVRMLSSHFEHFNKARPVLAVKHRYSPRVRKQQRETILSKVCTVVFPLETGL